MRRRGLILLLIIALPACAALADSESKVWIAQPKFRIENTSYVETLIFVSGISYALSTSNSELKEAGKQNFFCTKDGRIGSKLLIDILNDKHSGNITSEQAIQTIVQGLKKRFPCN